MLTGLGRLSAVVWGFVGLWVLFLLSGINHGPIEQTFAEDVKGWLVIGFALVLVYLMHRLTCWVLGSAARKPSHPPTL